MKIPYLLYIYRQDLSCASALTDSLNCFNNVIYKYIIMVVAVTWKSAAK